MSPCKINMGQVSVLSKTKLLELTWILYNHGAIIRIYNYGLNQALLHLNENGDPSFIFPNLISYNTNNQLAKKKHLTLGSISVEWPQSLAHQASKSEKWLAQGENLLFSDKWMAFFTAMYKCKLTLPVNMSYMSAPRLHQSTAFPWPLRVRISGALQLKKCC